MDLHNRDMWKGLLILMLLARPQPSPMSLVAAKEASLPTDNLCRVTATRRDNWVGRRVTIKLRDECPQNSYAYLSFRSDLMDPIADTEDGIYILRKGQVVKKSLFPHWYVAWRDRSGRLWRVPELNE